MDLIKISREIYNKLNIRELQETGIERENVKTSSHSHHIVTYPPLDALPEIKPDEIYPQNSRPLDEMALYLHLPFCTGKCLYCSYITLPNQDVNFINNYIDCLEKEIDLLLRFNVFNKVSVNSIYIGGGTPTYLSAAQLERIIKLLKNKFSIKKGAESTIEAGPETIIAKDGKEKMEILFKNGVNRVNIGFQTFNNDILKLINRRHNSGQAIEAFNLIKNAGFKNINIGLIPGLPDQTLEIWQHDLEEAAKLDPASVTCYPLTIKQASGMWMMYQKEQERFPSREDVILMHIMANEFFDNLKYVQRPVWWFTKSSDYEYKQQIYKWGEFGNQLALGVSSYSFINDCQYFNYRTVPEYINSLKENKLPIGRGVKLTEDSLMRRFILFSLKTGLNKEIFKNKFNKNPRDVYKKIWDKLEKLNLIEENEKIIELSYAGKLFADEVCREFYSEKIKK